jgi:hypothetical protein
MQQQHFLIARPIANSMPVSGSQCSETTAIARMLGATAPRGSIERTHAGLLAPGWSFHFALRSRRG